MTVRFTIENLDYGKVTGNLWMGTEIRQRIQGDLSSTLDVDPSMVRVRLVAGSVKVNAIHQSDVSRAGGGNSLVNLLAAGNSGGALTWTCGPTDHRPWTTDHEGPRTLDLWTRYVRDL